MAMIVREATIEDYKAICKLFDELDAYHVELEPETFQAFDGLPRPLERVTSFLEEQDKAFYVVTDDGVIVGFLNCELATSSSYPMFRPRRFVRIDNVFVTASQRRRGVARSLIEEAKKWGKSKSADKLQLSVYATNQGAIKAYQHLGFKGFTQTMDLVL